MKRATFGKRGLCLVLIVLLLALSAAPAFAASARNPHGAYVVATSKGDRLNVRSGPGGAVIDHLKRGTVVVYKGSKKGWWYVNYRNGSGFVDRTCLWSVDNSRTAKYTPVDNLWVRLEPKTDSIRLGKLKAGKKVTIVKQSGSWARINYKGHLGWVPSKYLFRVS